jgi:hypothetical protein
MAEDTHDDRDRPADHDEQVDEGGYETLRTTAPQSPYTMRDVGVGALVAAVGLLLVVVVPYLLA